MKIKKIIIKIAFFYISSNRFKIPIRGTASEVVGIDSATRFKKTVNDRRIVTPGKVILYFFCLN